MKHENPLLRPVAVAALLVGAMSNALCTASCTAPPDGPGALALVEARHEADARDYRAEQDRIAAALNLPVTLAFDGEGTLIVHEVELLGGPERAHVRVRFTYLNSTGRSVPIPTVHLRLHAPDGQIVEAASRELLRPLGSTFARDNAYTGWIDADARGVLRSGAWTWSMDLHVPSPARVTPALSSRGRAARAPSGP